MALGKQDQALFLVCADGNILSVKYPLQEPIVYSEYNVHSVHVTKVQHKYHAQACYKRRIASRSRQCLRV